MAETSQFDEATTATAAVTDLEQTEKHVFSTVQEMKIGAVWGGGGGGFKGQNPPV